MNLLKLSILVSLIGICVFVLIVNADVNSDKVINGESFETALTPNLLSLESSIKPNKASKLMANTVPSSNDNQHLLPAQPVFGNSEQKNPTMYEQEVFKTH
ncbi:hypothetical protein [Shewanella gaetbuli]